MAAQWIVWVRAEMAAATPERSGMGSGVRVTARQSLSNYLSSVAGNYAFLTISFFTNVYLTRSLGADGFGRLTLMFVVAQTASLFAAFWTHAGFLRYGAEELALAGTLRRVFWGRMLIVAPSVLGFVAVGWGFRAEIGAFHGVVGVGYWMLAAYFLALFASQTVQAVYQARGRAGTFAFLLAGERGLILSALLVLHLEVGPSLEVVLLTYLAALVAVSLVGCLLLDGRDFLPLGTSVEAVRRFMGFSWPILIGVFGSYFTSHWLDVVIIRHFLGSGAVGQYALAYQLMGAIQQLPMLSFPVLIPLLVGFFVSDRNASIQLYLDRLVPHAIFGMGVLLSAGTLVAPVVVPPIFGPAFTDSARALPVLLFSVGWYCVFVAYMPILNLHERTPAMLAASTAAAAANLLGDLLLVPLRGIVGAAWATVLSQCAGALCVVRMVRQDYRFPVLPVVSLLVPQAVVTVSVTLLPGWGASLVAGAVAAVVFVAAAKMQRLFSGPDRRLLASLDLPGVRWLLPVPARGDAL